MAELRSNAQTRVDDWDSPIFFGFRLAGNVLEILLYRLEFSGLVEWTGAGGNFGQVAKFIYTFRDCTNEPITFLGAHVTQRLNTVSKGLEIE
jgi:hypothetical protein